VRDWIEKLLGISVSRNPMLRYFPQFIELLNLTFIRNSTGILHIGAHEGEEAPIYFKNGKKAVFIEANPLLFQRLQKRISEYPDQEAINALIGNTNEEVNFFVANNDSQSSSVYDFSTPNAFEGVNMESSQRLPMHRLDNLIGEELLAQLDHWIIDVQGAELLVLQGAGKLLTYCRSMMIECSTRSFYRGGAQWIEVDLFLKQHGFICLLEPGKIAHCNLVYVRVGNSNEVPPVFEQDSRN
jgi:FkbM family methyltransferase